MWDGGVRLLVRDARGASDGEFDLVYCTGVLHRAPAPSEGLAELFRMSRPGGKVPLSLYHRGGFLPRTIRWHLAGLLVGVLWTLAWLGLFSFWGEKAT